MLLTCPETRKWECVFSPPENWLHVNEEW